MYTTCSDFRASIEFHQHDRHVQCYTAIDGNPRCGELARSNDLAPDRTQSITKRR